MSQLKWWQEVVFYQIYPRSFADGNGDGIGDFRGMIEKLDYLRDLGIGAIWLSPHYPSPMDDCGYDISDYTAVAPEYGTLEDFKAFLAGAHLRGMRVILDLVLNHTSDEHPWFLESRSSRDNPKRDWYIWLDPAPDGGAPNNWNSTFDGSAWEFDETTGQYYYHFFFKQQPDLNWRNPQVKQAMFDAARFWLDLGVDGFRLDAIGTIFEHPDMPNHPVNMTLAELRRRFHTCQTAEERAELGKTWEKMFKFQVEQLGMHELMQELRAVLDEYDGDRMLVGENDDIAYHGSGDNELHMVFNFPLMRTDRLSPDWIRANQRDRLAALGAISPESWPCNTLGNHDCPRLFTSFCDGLPKDALARLHLALMLTLRGTPFLYNGEEIGMTDLILEDIGQFRDTLGTWVYHAEIEELGVPQKEALEHAARLTRDKNRTPMQWQNAPNGGFSPEGVETWLPVNPDYASCVNVADQESNPASMLNFYRRMLHFRQQMPALIRGDYTPLHEDSSDYFAFLRRCNEQTCLVILNLSEKAHLLAFDLPGQHKTAKCVFRSSTVGIGEDILSSIPIQPYEVYIAEIQ